jgi:hypothetical protein
MGLPADTDRPGAITAGELRRRTVKISSQKDDLPRRNHLPGHTRTGNPRGVTTGWPPGSGRTEWRPARKVSGAGRRSWVFCAYLSAGSTVNRRSPGARYVPDQPRSGVKKRAGWSPRINAVRSILVRLPIFSFHEYWGGFWYRGPALSHGTRRDASAVGRAAC